MFRLHFDEVRKNNVRTTLLFIVFFAFLVGVGAVLGYFFRSMASGVIIAIITAVIYASIMYFAGKATVLKLSGAEKATKDEFPYLVNTVEGLAIAAGLPTPEVYVIRDPAMNAFATGRNPENGAIAVTTGLLNNMNREEIEGVLAHEMSHIQHHDIKVMLFAAVLVGAVVFLSHLAFRIALFGGGNQRDGRARVLFLVIGVALVIIAPFAAELIKLSISRKREYMADAGAAILTRHPNGLADALEKLKKPQSLKNENKALNHLYISEPKQSKLLNTLLSTHPPIDERIKRLRQM